MRKFTPLQISFGASILLHAAALGGYEFFKFNASKPAFQQDENFATLTLVAAPDEPAAPVVKIVAPIQPPEKLPEKIVEKIVPTETVQQAVSPASSSEIAIPQTNEVAVVAKPSQINFRGDASSPQPGQDAITVQAQPGIEAKPNYLKNPEPVYPELARRRHQEGLVLLAVKVTEQGGVAQIEVKKSSGFRLLDDAALEAVRDWKFEPARLGLISLESEIEVPVRFELIRK